MKKTVDNFSTQSEDYKKYRPIYPEALYEALLVHVKNKHHCWDCGTGNGQVAAVLAEHFDQVWATDISQQQINQAEKRHNIHYQAERAEQTTFQDNHFDLITCAQAVHWFDLEVFQKEVQRVGKSGALLAIWGYGLISIDTKLDELIQKFDRDIVGPFWNVERRHIDNGYQSIPFDFEKIDLGGPFSIQSQWTLAHLEGYFNSWSCVQNYLQHHNQNPVPALMKYIRNFWPDGESRMIRFPIFIKAGTIHK